ncbi:flagellar biosynthesis protein FlhB [Thermosipho melanesiensis]|uniref:Flagellar biosynthetic protein FlhB n=1 Tax=Thermosipho melanesiensis (strain DSM 12029 / CIP 104789 / BI429) TaxID=391009 RepID=A6LLA9_THEM4|nr:flagellar biosynthesis protein FlhB [Thermosipho melanesiensis]ABR30710.1 flagellar biosynthetic protein FlhB [Thermosipho melanesiensis BI429]OOC35779.1 flagellar biosynthesis protein FlhB [Thermosipho melanesiensis]OOC39078.1 flagellar biosynthesis protein FlhB [Thermosipho melanesiensis]OOC39226.1 flagellar biosynthesis protein FlhB [Thermosipho melanesiensis]OOC41753.1 flagellar biosynthesis protein FlhB [Thermosipho melanesiensis]
MGRNFGKINNFVGKNIRTLSFRINIQLFADPDKTEKATPRRRQKAREEGQVPISRELTSGFTFLAAVLGFAFLGRGIILGLESAVAFFAELPSYDTININDLGIYAFNAFKGLIIDLVIFVGIIMVTGIAVGSLQTKFLFTFKSLKLDFSKINPINGLKRMFSLRSLFELLKSILKLVIVGYVGYLVIKSNWNKMLLAIDKSVKDGSLLIWDITFELLIKCGIALFIVSIADYFFSRYEYEKNIRMTKQEVKEEFKEVEGNPEIKRKQREIMMQYSMHRMMQEVPEATVVITNPTHFAVAIKYEVDEMEVPIVVAKGMDNLAEKIKKVARENNVPILRNPKLARELYFNVDVGDEIPEKFYRAVAEVLAYVYSLKRD